MAQAYFTWNQTQRAGHNAIKGRRGRVHGIRVGALPYPGLVRLGELTPTELADLLARTYAADHGEGDDAPNAAERTALADSLGCHEEMRAAAFAVWCTELGGVTEDEAAYWLDVEFVEPCPEERAV